VAKGKRKGGHIVTNFAKGVGKGIGSAAKSIFDPGADNRRKAAAAQRQAMAEWQALKEQIPGLEEQQVNLERQGRSGMWSALADPESIAAQRESLGGLREIISGRGMTEADRARLQLAQQEQGGFMRGQREAVQQNMAERGMGGSGSELAGLLSGQQAATQGLASTNAQMAIAAQQRHDAALQGLGGLGGQMRGQSFGEAASRASAQDAINQFNARTQAQQEMQHKGLYQTQFGNRSGVAAGLSGQYQAEAARQQAQAASEEAFRNMAFSAGLDVAKNVVAPGSSLLSGGGGGSSATSPYGKPYVPEGYRY
jgi:hypothetical protein